MGSATFEALSFSFRVQSPSAAVARAVDFIYSEMRREEPSSPALEIEIREREASPRLELHFGGSKVLESDRIGDILHQLDNELSVVLEHARPDLYFVHAAVLAEGGRALLLVGDSGAGKSTTTYALAASGMDYLSDELAPMEPATGRVHPYPRAICLKRDPPEPFRLPGKHLRTEWTLHVGARSLSAAVSLKPAVVDRIVFVRYSPARAVPSLRRISPGEAALRLYQGALNQLAHPNLGLDGTLDLIRRAACFELLSAGIEETVRALRPPSGG